MATQAIRFFIKKMRYNRYLHGGSTLQKTDSAPEIPTNWKPSLAFASLETSCLCVFIVNLLESGIGLFFSDFPAVVG
jgi:hypothetical protein